MFKLRKRVKELEHQLKGLKDQINSHDDRIHGDSHGIRKGIIRQLTGLDYVHTRQSTIFRKEIDELKHTLQQIMEYYELQFVDISGQRVLVTAGCQAELEAIAAKMVRNALEEDPEDESS